MSAYSSSSLRVSSLSVPSLDSLRRSSLSSSSSGSTNLSGSQLWDSGASDSQTDLTDITPPTSPSTEDIKNVLEASLQTLITLKEEEFMQSSCYTPVASIAWSLRNDEAGLQSYTPDQGDAGYEAEAEEPSPQVQVRPKAGAHRPKGDSKARRHKRRAYVDPFSPITPLGAFPDRFVIPFSKLPAAYQKPGCLWPPIAELSPIAPYVFEHRDRKAHIGLGLGLPSTHPLQTIPETDVLPAPPRARDLSFTPEELPMDYLVPPESPLLSSPPPVRLGSSARLRPQDIADSPSPTQPLPPCLMQPLDVATRTRLSGRAHRHRQPASRWSQRQRIRVSMCMRPLVSPILEEDEDVGYS